MPIQNLNSPEQKELTPLSFTALENNSTISLNDKDKNQIFEISENNKDWIEWPNGTSIRLQEGDKVYIKINDKCIQSFRKKLAEYLCGNITFKMSGKIAASGDCRSLNGGEITEACFYKLFKDCDALISAPELPATELAKCCYEFMFKGCTNLKQAPELYATESADYCYAAMFEDCTKLEKAPELPATKLKDSCYLAMFRNCTNLKEVPELPATELAESCYKEMFSGCTIVKQLPKETESIRKLRSKLF